MTISGNISSNSFAQIKHARVEGDIRVYPGELDGDDATWPCGLLLVKDAYDSKWAPLATIPETVTWLLGVLDEDTDTAITGSGPVVRMGAVKLSELKVGVVAQAAPSAEFIHELEAKNIYAV